MKKKRIGGVDIQVVASESMPKGCYVLVTGQLSLAGKETLRRRVAAGENEQKVLAELLVAEGKAVTGSIE